MEDASRPPRSRALGRATGAEEIKDRRDVGVVLCPPFVDLVPLAKAAAEYDFEVGVQNLHPEEEGAFTGEISAPMVKDLARYAILGHSERRRYFFEDDGFIARKVATASAHGLVPILCVGETLNEREHGLSRRVVTAQLEADLRHVSAEEVARMVIAYEPVWAIGTGKFAKPDEVIPVVRAIRETVGALFGEAAEAHLRLLYGGSTEPENTTTYLKLDGINGLLVGGASINAEKFSAMVTAAAKL